MDTTEAHVRVLTQGRCLNTAHSNSGSETGADPKQYPAGKRAQYVYLPAMAQSLAFLDNKPTNDWDQHNISFS